MRCKIRNWSDEDWAVYLKQSIKKAEMWSGKKWMICPTCAGKGGVGGIVCPTCGGFDIIEKKKEKNVKA